MSRDQNDQDRNGSDRIGQTDTTRPNRRDREVLFRDTHPLQKFAASRKSSHP